VRELIGTAVTDNQFLRSDLEKLGLSPRARDTMERLPQDRDILVQQVNDVTTDLNEVEDQPFLTWDTAGALMTACRLLLGTAANISLTISATEAVIDLISTAVAPGTYGGASKLASFTVDQKGRITAASQTDIDTDNIVEGVLNLFFTQARARASVSGSAGVTYNGGTGDFTLDQAFTRGLLSGGSGINYNSSTGAIATTGFTGTGAYTNFTYVNGICTAAS